MLINELFSSRDSCNVCGQTPCNCTHLTEGLNPIGARIRAAEDQGVAEGTLNEFAPGGNSSSSYYAVTANFVSEFSQQKEEEIQDLIAAGWTKQDLEQAGTLQGQAADIAHFEQVRDGFLKGLKPGFDAYLQGDTQMKDQLGEYWLDNDLPLNQDWEKIYGEPWGDDMDESVSNRALSEFSIGGDDDGEPKDDPYKYPKPEHYRRSIDFFGKFEANHFDKEDMDDATGVFKGYWYYGNNLKQIAYFKFDNPQRTGSNDPGMGWYYEPQDEDVAEGYSLGKVLSLPELLDQIKHILTAKHPGIGWRMTMPAENTFLFSAQNDYDVWSMLVVEPGGDDWVAVGHGMVDPDGKPIIFDRQQLPMTLASASEIADEAIQTYHDIDLSDYADDEDYNQGVAEGWKGTLAGSAAGGIAGDVAGKAIGPLAGAKIGAAIGGLPGAAAGLAAGTVAGGPIGSAIGGLVGGKVGDELGGKEVDESGQQKGADYRDPPEADYGDDYQDMVSRVKKLAGLGPLKTQYDPKKRVYRNMPTAVQPKK